MAPLFFCRLLFGSIVLFSSVTLFAQSSNSTSTNGNRLAYLDDSDPFYPGLHFPKLTTPQWIGEKDVEAVVILAIDDMRDPKRYEAHIRPILERLKKIDGRAPFSIMCNAINIAAPELQPWLKEGVSLEVHTLSHPCPLLAKGNFQAAADTYHGCVDLLNHIPNNAPVAFRMPCCDSINSPSPRFYAEIFNSTNSAGQFLSIDSSVMMIPTSADKEIPRDLVIDKDGKERFRKYLPFPSFVTTIENYPYPYVIGKLCWQFPAMVPSDWEAQHIHGTNNPITVADWERALDITVLKQGVFTFIFHPHGWISANQMIEFIDYAVTKYGKKVKFLNFREALERINANLLAGHPLRSPTGGDNGVRLLDLNNDGYLDVVIGRQRARVWTPTVRQWQDTAVPATIETETRFGIGTKSAPIAIVPRSPGGVTALAFRDGRWSVDPTLLHGLEINGQPLFVAIDGRDRGVRLRDIDNDGVCELIVANESQSAIFSWSDANQRWQQLGYKLPRDTMIVDEQGRDAGLRFIDLNDDGFADVLFSNERRYSLHLFRPVPDTRLMLALGWTDEIISQKRADDSPSPLTGERAGVRGENSSLLPVPPIVRSGPHPNNGAWFHSGTLWIQNEDTASLTNLVDRRSFKQLLTCDQPPPLSPEESLASIKVRPGFKVELVASEPLVQDPIGFEWGADGKLWVVEMGDYPLGIDGKGKSGGRVRFLEDTDGDGKYDKSTIFLDGLNFPNGVMPWRKGVIVCAVPEIFYAEDADGDGKADVRKVLFTGFAEGNQQHRANGFEYGLDGWLYGANGDSSGTVTAIAGLLAPSPPPGERAGERGPLNLRGHDFRIDPDRGLIETVAGQTQYGRHRDDWGNWFGNNNPTWLWHYYIDERYLARNPNLAVKSTKRILANYNDSSRCYPISRTMNRFNDPGAANHTTSANSATAYRDELFGPEFATSIFISEPVHNLIHREVLEPDGISFKSHRAKGEEDSEFLASTDNWFRPTMLKTGPDGALYIADMYRLVIEHPEWIPAPMQKRLDLRAGSDKGRIYRVYPEKSTLRTNYIAKGDLIAALDSPNGWQRDTAQRLMAQMYNPRADQILPWFTQLKQLFAQSSRGKTRLQALATLSLIDAITPVEINRGLNDAQLDVKRLALRLAEPLLEKVPIDPKSLSSEEALLVSNVTAVVDDANASVRYQAALSLGYCKSPLAARALLRIAHRDEKIPDMLAAILSSAVPHAKTMLGEILNPAPDSPDARALLGPLLTSTTLSRDPDALSDALHLVTRPQSGHFALWQYHAFAGLLDELKGLSLAQFFKLNKSKADIEPLLREARQTAANPASPVDERIAALSVLGRGVSEPKRDLEILAQMLSPQNPAAVQEAAMATLKKSIDPSGADVLLSNWRALGPNIRMQALNLINSRGEWIRQLLNAIEAERIGAGEIGVVAQQKLLLHPDLGIRERAEKIFGGARTDRAALVRQYTAALTASGDAQKGAAIFRQNCMVCHRLHGEGNEIGPDLGMVASKPNETLLAAILDPNQAVETRYISYNVTTKNGREVSGIISAETATSITLRTAGGTEELLRRNDIKELSSSGLSLMPDGLEKTIPPAAMADLLAYLRAK